MRTMPEAMWNAALARGKAGGPSRPRPAARAAEQAVEEPAGKTSKAAYLISGLAVAALGAIVLKGAGFMPQAVTLSIGAVAIIALALCAVTRMDLVLLAFTVYIPFSKQLPGDFGAGAWALNLTNIMLVLCLFGWAAAASSRNRPFYRWRTLDGPIVLFCLFGLFSVIRATEFLAPGAWWHLVSPLKRWLSPVLLYFLFVNNVHDRETIKRLMVAISIGVTMVAMMALWDFMNVGIASSLEKMRIEGVMDQPNTLGAFFCYYAFLIAAAFLVHWRKPAYWLLLVPLALCFRAVTITFSRGALLAFCVGAAAVAALKHWALPLAAGLGLAVAAPVVLQNPPEFLARLMTTVSSTQDPYTGSLSADFSEEALDLSARKRIIIWRGAMEMIREFPLTGIGYGIFPYKIDEYSPIRGMMDAHNTYLLIAAEMGLPALLTFFCILLMAWWAGWQVYRRASDPLIKTLGLGFTAGMISLLVANCFGSRFDEQAATGYFWILCGLILRAREMLNEGELR